MLVTLFLRFAGIGVFLPEVAVDFVVDLIPGTAESFFVTRMGEGAKLLAIVVAVVVFLLLPGVYALFFRWFQARLPSRLTIGLVYSLGPTAIALFMILPLLGGGFAGLRTPAGPAGALLSQLLGSSLYATLLDYFLVEVAERYPEGFSPSRRHFIAVAAGALGALALAIYGFGFLVARQARSVFSSVQELFSKEVTPTEEFYVVSKNVIDPMVDSATWQLDVDGLVSSPGTYTYDELLTRLNKEEFVTLECVSNEVGGNLISTARWEGIPLGEILGEADLEASADWIVFTCADGYTVAIPRDKAEDPTTLLALRMNGEALPFNHGFPARIIVPGLYGMFSAKWVTRITPVQGEFLGFWQEKGWTNRGEVRTTTIIATPPSGSTVSPPVALGGFAFAGDRGISKVEVSTDGGESWEEATLKAPPLSQLTWVIWTFLWSPEGQGRHRVLARATDGIGTPQDASRESPFPRGASGYDSIALQVSPSALVSLSQRLGKP